MNKCKNICKREPIPCGKSTYEHCRRCNLCDTWFLRDGRNRCICCGVILREGRRAKGNLITKRI